MKMIAKITKFLEDKDEKNLINNIVGAFLIKGISLFISLYSMPLYIKYFDNDVVLGFWYTILSLLSWISICDLGLGNGLRNELTVSIAKNDADSGKKYIASTYGILSTIIFPVIIIANLILRMANLNLFFNVPEDVISAKGMLITISILLIGIGVNFVLKIINSILYALQKSAINNVIALVSSVIPLVYMYLSNGGSEQENLINLSLVHVIAINVPLLIATIMVFCGKTLKNYRPSFKQYNTQTARRMLNLGMKFFLAQVFFLALLSTNETLISYFYSPQYVVEYTIYSKISTLIGSVFMLALTPLWSKITKDLSEKKYYKINRTNHLLYVISFIAMLCQFLIIPILQWVLNIWLKDETIAVNYGIAIVFAFYGSLYIFNIVLTTVANAMGELKTQVVFYGVGAILKIPTTIFLSQMGISWYYVIVYNCVILLAFCVFQFLWIENRIKKLIGEK